MINLLEDLLFEVCVDVLEKAIKVLLEGACLLLSLNLFE